MASKKKTIIEVEKDNIIPEEDAKKLKPEDVIDIPEQKEEIEVKENKPKAKIGEIVFVSRTADTDLNGFKLFPQYKKYTYTVEDYDAASDVYSLRRANLLLRLKGEFILRPEEKAHDKLNRIQF